MTADPAKVEEAVGSNPSPGWSRLGRVVIGRNPRLTFIRLILTVGLILVVTKTCLVPIRVTGRSMEPTYRNGRVNLLNLLAYRMSEPRRGDVVGIRQEGRRMIF